jgi:hypothetical protein
MNKLILTAFLLFLGIQNIFGQKKPVPSILLTSFNFAYHNPEGDLSKRFGSSLSVGIDGNYLFGKSKWTLGAHFNYLFGADVKEDVVKGFRDSLQNIPGTGEDFGNVYLRERGYEIGIDIGRFFVLHDNGNNYGGIKASIGVGFMQHQILIKNDGNNVPQLIGFNTFGYDRLSNGISISEFIGYQYLSRNKSVNFYIGVESFQGFTQNRRTYNYDTKSFDTTKRLDVLWGVKVGWVIPLFSNASADEIEY